MVIKEVDTGIELEAEIGLVLKEDFAAISINNDSFLKFDWLKYTHREVYKLRLKNDVKILGLMCILDHTDPLTNAIEIELLEVADEHVGSKKKYEYIAGCLIAFACRESILRGHDGFVFLIPKTELIVHYQRRYGFEHIPLKTSERPEGFMVAYGQVSYNLIEKYKL